MTICTAPSTRTKGERRVPLTTASCNTALRTVNDPAAVAYF